MSRSAADVVQPATESSHSQRLADKCNVDVWLSKKSSGEMEVLGAFIGVQPDAYSPKKDYVTCTRVPPHERHWHVPDLRPAETIAGEVYAVSANKKVLKNGITLWLPFVAPAYPEVQELKLKVKRTDEPLEAWHYCDYTIAAKGDGNGSYMEVLVRHCAWYVPTVVAKRETFLATDQGLLYNARISRYVAVRFPKKCIDRSELEYYIEVQPLKNEKELEVRRDYPEEMAPFESISDFVDIFGPQMQFKRPLSLKLGVPLTHDMDLERLASAIVVLRKSPDDSWCVLEDSLKVTKTAVSFTTKELGRFVVAVVEPSKKLWLRKYMPMIERVNSSTKCEVLVFTRLDKKVWSLWVEVAPMRDVAAVVDCREQAGMRCINKPQRRDSSSMSGEKDPYYDGRLSSRRQRSASKETGLLFVDSVVNFWIEVGGDVKLVETEETSGRRLHELLYCDSLQESFRLFDVEPTASGGVASDARGIVSVYVERAAAAADKAQSSKECVRTWDFKISQRQVEEYCYVEQETDDEVIETKMEVDVGPEQESQCIESAASPPPSPKRSARVERSAERARQREVTVFNLMRLTESKRAKTKVDREPKVLSGRSLMTLSRRVDEGLTLAVYLDIPDSTITGLGFDALANGLSLPEVTYKILLLWKRRAAVGGQAKVEQLAGALKAMGRSEVVAQLWEHHLRNCELTPDSFLSTVGGEDAS